MSGNDTERDQTFRAVLRSTPHGLCMLHSTWNVRWSNRALELLLSGRDESGAGLMDLHFSRLLANEADFEEYSKTAVQNIRGSGCDTREIELKRLDGSSFWAEVSLVRHDPAQTDLGFVATVYDLRERKRAEAALEESERRIRALLENSIDLILVLDPQGGVRYASPSFERVLERSSFGKQRHFFHELVHKEDLPAFRAALTSAKADAADVTLQELRLATASGVWRTFSVVVANRLNAPEINGILLNCHDITEQIDARNEVWDQKAFLHRVIDTDPSLIFVKDAGGFFTLVNNSMAEFRGLAPKDLVGKHESEIYQDSTAIRRFLEEDKTVIESGRELRNLDQPGMSHTGEVRFFETIKRPIEIADTAARGVLVIAIDVTKRRLAEQESVRLASFPRESPHPVLSCDKHGEIAYRNPATERLIAELKLGGPLAMLPSDHKSLVSSALQTGEGTSNIEVIVDGRVLLWTYHPVPEIGTVHLYGTDISPLREAQATLHQREEQLLHAQKLDAIGRLAGGVAHDFNNLLTVIKGHAEILLQRKLAEDDPLRHDIRQIRKASHKAAVLTQQLLTFGRRHNIEPQIIDLDDVLQDIERILQRLIGEHIALDIISQPSTAIIYADPGQIEQVLVNLVVNARDAMPTGGRVTVDLSVEQLDEKGLAGLHGLSPGKFAVLRVTDTGCGIRKDVLDKIFDPFFTTKEIGKGTGLGLSTVYGVVKRSGGDVRVESEPGHGTTFHVYLPVVSGTPIREEASSPFSQERSDKGECVLLVEDEELVREMTRDVLEHAGYKVLEARNTSHAVEICDRHFGRIDLLLSDIVMPNMSGPELARRVSAKRAGCKVLYVSGYPHDELEKHGLADKDLRVLAKPFSPNSLLRMVKLVLAEPDR